MSDTPTRASMRGMVEDRDHATLAFIRRFHADHDYYPTLRQIAAGIGLSGESTASVRLILTRLERDGHIRRVPGVAQGIRLVHQ